jgi:hypothetical protein
VESNVFVTWWIRYIYSHIFGPFPIEMSTIISQWNILALGGAVAINIFNLHVHIVLKTFIRYSQCYSVKALHLDCAYLAFQMFPEDIPQATDHLTSSKSISPRFKDSKSARANRLSIFVRYTVYYFVSPRLGVWWHSHQRKLKLIKYCVPCTGHYSWIIYIRFNDTVLRSCLTSRSRSLQIKSCIQK